MIQRNKIQENVSYDIRSKIKYFACSRSLRTKQRCWILVDLVSKRFVNKKKKEHVNIFYLSIISSGANFLVLCHSMKKPGCEWLDEIPESKIWTFTYLCRHPCFFLAKIKCYLAIYPVTRISVCCMQKCWLGDTWIFSLFETTGFQLGMLTVYPLLSSHSL